MIVCCTHRSVSYSAIITGAPSRSKWAQIQKLTAIYHRVWDTLEHSALNGMSTSIPLPGKSGNPEQRVWEPKGMEGTRKQSPLHQHKQSSQELGDWSRVSVCTAMYQILWIQVMASNLGFLWDSWVCKWVVLWFLCYLLGSFPPVVLSCPNIIVFVLYFILLYYFSNEWMKT